MNFSLRTVENLNKIFNFFSRPSSHSQFMFFVTVYLLLFVIFRLNHHGSSKLNRFIWVVISAACLGLASIVAYGRVYLGYHSFSQVYWGSGIGAAFAIFWFLTTQFVFTPWFPWLCSTRLFELFLIRDYTDIPNVIWFDYVYAKNEAKNRNRKKSFKNKLN